MTWLPLIWDSTFHTRSSRARLPWSTTSTGCVGSRTPGTMIVMHSLFEEQITSEQLAMNRSMEAGVDSFAEALSYLPEPDDDTLGPHEYLEQVRKIKAAVSVPIIGSLNGTTEGGWLEYLDDRGGGRGRARAQPLRAGHRPG